MAWLGQSVHHLTAKAHHLVLAGIVGVVWCMAKLGHHTAGACVRVGMVAYHANPGGHLEWVVVHGYAGVGLSYSWGSLVQGGHLGSLVV